MTTRAARPIASLALTLALALLAVPGGLLVSSGAANADPSCEVPPSGLASVLNDAGPGIVLTWEASSCAPDEYALYRRNMDEDGSSMRLFATVDGATLSYTDTSIEAGGTYRYRIRSNDKGPRSASTELTAPVPKGDTDDTETSGETPRHHGGTNSDPAFGITSATRDMFENSAAETNVGFPVEAIDPDAGDTLAYSLSGTDASSFTVDSSTGQIKTRAGVSYDYEARNSYSVSVGVRDNKDAAGHADTVVDDTIEVTVTVGDVDEPGTLVLSHGVPRAGSVQRARLHEDDAGVTDLEWRWHQSSDQQTWTRIQRSNSHHFEPGSSLEGLYLRARARYTDKHGSGKTVVVMTTEPVAAAETAPTITIVELISGLSIPWGIAFAPDGTMLFSERSGVLSSRLTDGTVQGVTAELGDLFVDAEVGLTGIVVDPEFASNHRFYTCQSYRLHPPPQNPGHLEIRVVAWTINASYTEATRVSDPLVEGIPFGNRNTGCRLRFGPDGHLWVTTGDAGGETNAQDLTSLAGKVLRVDASTGAAAPGNPFAPSLVYSYGHRNPQGLALRPGTRQMWSVEHGPSQDDEINLLVSGANYGWQPAPNTYDEGVMTDLKQFPDAVEARWSSGADTIATSGGIFLEGDDWGIWEGRLAVASLKNKSLRLLEFDADGVLLSEHVVGELKDAYGRLRTPMMGPNGALYVSTSAGGGSDKILLVAPSQPPSFPSDSVTLDVQENSAAPTVVGTVTATDPEGKTLTYALSGPDADSFDVPNPSAGQLQARESFDYETKDSYGVVIKATDNYGLSDSVTVTIEVTNVVEDPEVSVSPATATVDGGDSVTLDGAAPDPDGDTLTYAWTSDGGGTFANASALDTTWTAPAKTNDVQNVVLTLTVTDNGAGRLAGTATVSVAVRANKPPTALITSAPATVNGRGGFMLTATASDPDLDVLTYEWTSSRGGTFENGEALNPTWTAPAATGTSQNVTLTLTVSDTSASATDTVPVTVRANEAPEASVSPATATVNGGGTVSLDGTATDPEGDRLTYSWASDGGGNFENAFELDTTWTAPAKTNDVQNVVLTLTVTDDGAGRLVGTATVSVAVLANKPPTASITSTPASVNGRGAFMLTATASDPDLDVLTYKWTSSGWGSFVNDEARNPTWTAPAATSTSQDITLTLTVTDATEASASDTVRVTVRANQAPEVSVSPATATVNGGGTVSLDGTATDPEGDRLTYSWASDGGGSFKNAFELDTTWTAPAKANDVQNVVLTLTVTDDGAGRLADTATVSVAVRANEPPTASITSAPATVNGRGGFMLTATASDPDLDVLTYKWTSSGGGSFVNDEARNTTWTAPDATGTSQNVTLTLTVSDTSASATDTVRVTVPANQVPEVSVSPATATVNGGGTVSLDGTATDPEGDRLTYSWVSDGGGNFENAFELDTTWTAPAKANDVQNVVLTLTVTDNGAGRLVGTATVSVAVRANKPPTASITSAPATVNGRGAFVLIATASDPDRDVLTYEWTSSRGGTFANGEALNPTWTAPAATSTSQDITLTLTVTDATEASASDTVRVTVRANQAPEASVSPATATVNGGGTVTLDGTASDLEGDTLTYSWASDGGGSFKNAFELDTTWTAPAKANDVQNVVLTLTVTDDGAGRLVGTATVSVAVRANEPPTASITSAPATVNGRGGLMLTATASDPDRDVLTYKWTSSGGGSFANGEALNPTWTAPAATSTSQDVTLTFTVSDTSASASDTVRVTVRANQAPEVSVSPATATVNGGGTVTLDGTATDPEGDTLTYSWASDGGGSFKNAFELDTTWTAPAKANDVQNVVLTLTVTDDGAGRLVGTATVSVAVLANEPPTASITSTPATVNGRGAFMLTATASDLDLDVLTYKWTSSGGGSFVNDEARNTTWTAPDATGTSQNVTLTLTVSDTSASATDTVRVTVPANQAPEVFVAQESATVGGGNSLVLDGRATDPEGGSLTYSWASDGGGSFDNASDLNTSWTAPAATNAVQNITLTLTVTDDGAGRRRGTATVSVTVPERDNTAPRVSATTSTSAVLGGGTVRLGGVASDPQNDPLTYAWTSNGEGIFADAAALGTAWTAPAAGVSDRGVTLTLTVTDTPGASATATVSVTVRENQAPTASATGSPDTVDGGGMVTLDGMATDQEDDDLTYTWRSSGGGTFDDASALHTPWTAPPKTDAVQSVVLTLTVTDAGAGRRTDAATVSITVRANQEPSASATADPSTVNGRGTVTLDGTASDRDGDTLTYEWRSNAGTFADSSALDTIWTAPRATTADETIVLTLTVTDATASASATASVTVRANQAPRVTVSPATATVEGDGELEVSGGATDPEGDRLTYAWSSNGGGSFADSSASDTTWTAPPKTDTNQSITLTHTVTDDGAGARMASGTVEVTVPGNEPPPGPTATGGGGGGGGPSGPVPSGIEFEWNVTRDIEQLDGGHDAPTGAWSDGTLLWLAHNGDGADDAVYAYDLATGERVEDREFELHETNRAPRGVASDGVTMWIADSGRDTLFAHDLGSGERLAGQDVALHRDNADPRGIWSDGVTMWVLDGGDEALFAYDLASGEVLAEYALDSGNDDPRGLWSDGVTIWVSDHGAKRLFAYRIPRDAETASEDEDDAAEEEDPGLERVIDEEFKDLPKASNNSPRGIWSDGDVMYVADKSDGRVYSYNLPDAIDARLASLTLSGVDIGDFSSRTEEYAGVLADGVTETTVAAEATQRRASVSIEPPDANQVAEGHQLALGGVEAITVTVTSADGSRERVYRVRLGDAGSDPARDPWPHCLRGAVSEGFSLVVYEGGSVEELVACAESREIVALYALHEGVYVSYILGAPDFVNREFSELFADGLLVMTALTARSEGPPSADPFGDALDDAGPQPWPQCLRGAVVEGFSLVVYEGGTVEELVACAESQHVAALYALHDGEWVSYILGAPQFVNAPFRELFPGVVPAITPLVARSEAPPDRQ